MTLGFGQALRVFCALAYAYLLSYGLRAINAVIAPELIGEFKLSNTELGALTSAYFFAFAALQLPVGGWLDRFGPRRTHASLLIFAALGCAVFATATSVTQLTIGRALVGVGIAAGLMASLKSFRLWFAPHRQAQLALWMLTVGTIGVLSATSPVRWVLPHIGWRGVFWSIAAALLLASVIVFCALPRSGDRPAPAGAARPGSYRAIMRDRYFIRTAVCAVTLHASLIVWQSLWVGPWFTTVLGASAEQAGDWLFVFNLAMLCGFISLSSVVSRFARLGWPIERIIALSNALGIALMVACVAWPTAQSRWLWFVFALNSSVNTIMQTNLSMTFPAHWAGRANSAYNFVMFCAIFTQQWGIGVLTDRFITAGLPQARAFRMTLAVMIVIYSVGWLIYVGWRVPPRQPWRRDARAVD